MRRARELLGIEAIETAVETIRDRQSGDSPRLADLSARVAALEADLRRSAEALEAAEERATFTEWVASMPLRREPLVSVVVVTQGHRQTGLRYALKSIAGQSYQRFEVLVVGPEGLRLPTPYGDDERFHSVHTAEDGSSHRRNAGLKHAKGEFITYCDDDNTMGPQWLRALVAAFLDDAEIDVVYGARLHERREHGSSATPAFWWFERTWSPAVLQSHNPIDTGVLAHRAGLAETCWDEALESCGDWDLAIRLTAAGRVKPLPVRACTYTVSAPGRITDSASGEAVHTELRRRARSVRRVRLLGVSHSFPRHSEAYIESELRALLHRFDVAVASEFSPITGIPSAFQHLGQLDAALVSFQPEVVMFHYADVAVRLAPQLAALRIPYAVRVHSYDLELAKVAGFHADPQCLGVWVYPQHVAMVPGSHALNSLMHDAHLRPHPTGERSGVIFTSACLPKRDWDLVAGVLGNLRDLQRTVILATCHGSETLVDTTVSMIGRADPRIQVRTDIPNSEVMRALSVASALFVVGASNHVFGNPRSVIEAWLSGAIPVMPDTPDAHAFAGDHARYYSDPSQAAQMIRDIEFSGDELMKERLANMDYALETFASPSALDRFASEVRSSFDCWESRHG